MGDTRRGSVWVIAAAVAAVAAVAVVVLLVVPIATDDDEQVSTPGTVGPVATACTLDPTDDPSTGVPPAYPGADRVGSETMSAEGGGGGSVDAYASADAPCTVAQWYAGALGAPTEEDEGWNWRQESESESHRSVIAVTVGAAGEVGIPLASGATVPADARTVIVVTTGSFPLEDTPHG